MGHYEECYRELENCEVKNPAHYDLFPGQQAIDIIKAALTPEEFSGFCKGNALKYRLRAGNKGDLQQDIDKANWYQEKLREPTTEWPDESRIDMAVRNSSEEIINEDEAFNLMGGDYV